MADIQMVVGVDYSELTGLIKTGEQTKRVLSSVAKDFARTGNQKQYMHSINKIAMAQKNLDVSARMSRGELMRLGAEMQREQKFTDALTASTNRLGGAIGASKNKMNGSNMAIQQMGYQFGDFAVQVQGGTSAFVAFSQQATQLVGILPMVAGSIGLSMGAAVGLSAALGVIIPIGSAIGRMFMEMNTSANAAAEKIKKFEERVKSAKGETLEMVEALRLLRSGFETESELALYDSVVKAKDELRLALIAKENIANAPFESDTNKKLALDAAQLKINSAKEALGLAREDLKLSRLSAAALDKEKTRQARQESVINQLAQSRAIIQKEARDAAEKELKRSEKATGEYNKQWQTLSDKTYLLEVEKQYGVKSIIFLTEQSRLRQAAYQSQLEASGMAEDQVSSLVSLNKEMEDFNLKLAASTLNSERLARNLATAASFNTGGVGGEFGGVPTGLDAFGGKGDYRYDESSKIKIEKKAKEKKVRDPVADFETRLKLERELLNATESRQKVLQALGSDFVRDNPKRAAAMEVTITETNRLIAVEEKRQGLIDSITGSIENGMMAMIDGTLSVKDAFKSMAAEIIKELYRVLVVQQMVNAAKGFFGLTAADGAVVSGGSEVKAYANGGVVSGPTTFPMAGGKTGLMGEAGPEAIMPLKRGANGKLGVQMEGGGGDVININQSFNFQANGDDSVKKLIAQAAPKIADMAKASVIDSRRRGGSTKAAFG